MKLDPYTWRCLQEICHHRNMSVHDFCTEVHRAKPDYCGFATAVRIAILRHYRDLAAPAGGDLSRAPTPVTARRDGMGRLLYTSPV